ncbi:MAG: OmpA family protein [Treponema sp.]
MKNFALYPHDMQKAVMAFWSAVVVAIAPLSAEIFRFQFKNGDSYRINSVVQENVFFNGRFSHQAEIINRITVEVSDVQQADAATLASARYTCSFMTSEKNETLTFSWGREYPSVFRRDALGNYTISSEYVMPVVRDVPVFPERDVVVGESWSHQANEAHDLRDSFGIKEPLIVPFIVHYTYKGPVLKEGKTYQLIEAVYNLNYTIPRSILQRQLYNRSKNAMGYPVKTTGYSKQQLYWDNETGILPFYEEVFDIQMTLNTGDIVQFQGTAHAETIDNIHIDKNTITEKLNEHIRESGIENTFVQKTDEGITIRLEDIRFESDSAQLKETEKLKLQKLGKLLKEYSEHELLISGHTANAGTAEDRKLLSEQRAAAVAAYLIELGVRKAHHIYTQGFGAEKPVVPETSEQNRARNRRVEITILEK